MNLLDRAGILAEQETASDCASAHYMHTRQPADAQRAPIDHTGVACRATRDTSLRGAQ